MAQQSARRGRNTQGFPQCFEHAGGDLDLTRELPYRPATIRCRIRGRTDGSIRLRAITIPKISLAQTGAFSNRISIVNWFFLLSVAEPGSRFSPRSASAAATSGPKHGRCDVHNGLTCAARSPRPSVAVGPHPRPGGQLAFASAWHANGFRCGLVTRSLAALTNGMARLTAKCYAEPPTASAPAPPALCPARIAWQSPVPNPSSRMPA